MSVILKKSLFTTFYSTNHLIQFHPKSCQRRPASSDVILELSDLFKNFNRQSWVEADGITFLRYGYDKCCSASRCFIGRVPDDEVDVDFVVLVIFVVLA